MTKGKTIYGPIKALRREMAKEGIDVWYDAGTDPHLGEDIPDHWKTRTRLSGFTGSAGTILVTQKDAGLWTDSRYYIQAEKELAGTGITLYCAGKPGIPSVEEYMIKTLPPGSVLGFNGQCMPASKVARWFELFEEKEFTYCGDRDLVEKVWSNRPPLPVSPVFRHDLPFSGEASPKKIDRIRKFLLKKHAEGILFTLLDEIAWILNIRGKDIPYNPLVISYLWIDRNKVVWFVDSCKISPEMAEDLTNEGIECRQYHEAERLLPGLSTGKHVFVDNSKLSFHFENVIRNAALKIIKGESPATHFKSVKNQTEQKGIRNAHLRDGVALVRWMTWFNREINGQNQTEITIADKLEAFRSMQDYYQGLSFPTIAGYNEHGAIVHYSATPNTASVIHPRGFLLVDSGAHYKDGTTDITRTLALSEPTTEQKKHYTLVVKGLINLSMAVFPEGTIGANLDILARKYLWQEGLNYGHGTGHGVGCFLNVHEGPQRISLNSTVPLKTGMLISNEPGLYFEGKYGIRVENLILCKKSHREGFLEFETVTLCPIDTRPVDTSLLSHKERRWLNNYHTRVCNALLPALNPEEKAWLKEKTQPI